MQTEPTDSAARTKVVYHVNDMAVVRATLRYLENHLNADPEVDIVVVSHGKGIDFLLKDAADGQGAFGPEVARLAARGVAFRVCNNTLKGNGLTPADVRDEVRVVPAGVAEIARLQAREGYAYIKP
jgi:intracellular sulfur oxidation DsrE/DsrF family protein